jgi:hypothetical protein
MNNTIAREFSHKLIMEELEARQLFSDGIEGVIVQELPPQPATYINIDSTSNSTAQSGDTAIASNPVQDGVRQELVFVDTDVKNYQELLNDIYNQSDAERNIQVILLDNDRDGIQQITQALSQYSNLDAVHLISHGSDGSVDIGNSQLNFESLTRNQETIIAWGNSFTENGDLLIYGCDVAETQFGQDFIDSLSSLTSTDVAASVDTTGNSSLGGDWILEFSTGSIETAVAPSAAAQASWQGILATATFQEGVSGYTGTSDTYLNSSSSGTNYGASGTLQIITPLLLGSTQQSLISFNLSSIPAGSIVTGASVTFTASTAITLLPSVNIYKMLSPWTETSTWNSLSNGVSPNNIDASSTADASWGALIGLNGTATLSGAALASTVQSWINNPASNRGWLLTAGVTAVQFYSSEAATTIFRPQLSITYTAPTPPVMDLDANNSSGATGSNYTTSFTENGPAVKIADIDATVISGSNSISPNLSGMTVTISNLLDGAAESLAVTTSGTSITASYNAGVLTLSGSDTAANYQTVLRSVTYNNTSNAPNTTSRIINVVATDPYGGNSTTASTTINLTAVNDAPTGSVTLTGTPAQGQTLTASHSLADADGLGVISYQWLANGSAISGATASSYVLTEAEVGKTLSVTASYTDGYGTAESVSSAATAAVANVNDAPTATNLNTGQGYTEDTPLALTAIVISDVDSATVTATLTLSDVAAGSLNTATSGTVTSTFAAGVWSASGAIADVNALLAGLTFTPALNYNSSFTIATSISDGVAAPLTGSKAITGSAVNDAPTAANLNADQSYIINTPLDLIDIVVSDVDSATVTATLTLSDVAAGSLNTATSGTVTSTFAAGVWSASGAIADVNALLAGLTFTPALNYNSSFTIATSISDGVAAPLTGSKAINGVLTNTAPTATNLNAGQGYTEDTPLALTAIVISDVDSATVTATLTLSDVTAGSLNTATSGTVTSTFAAGVWSASGAIADVNALLAGLTFTPTLNYNSSFTIVTSISDGVAAPLTGSKSMTGIAVNDAPTAANLNAGQGYTEDTPLALTAIVISDVDSATVTATLTLSDVASGSLNTATSGTVTSTFAAGVWSASGAIADVNALLAGLTFTPALNYNSSFTITTSVSDGVAAPLTGSKAINGLAVNDTPTGSVTIAGIAAQGQTLTASHSLADADGLGVISYQWLANGSAISGATASSYVLTEAEVGQTLTVTASYSDGRGTNESVSSAVTAAVANVNDAPTGNVTIAGIAAQGQTLSASHTLADADGLGVISYQWLANGSAITGATGSSYVLTEAEVGQTLTVTAGYSDGRGTNESAVSAVTAAVANVNDAPTGNVTIAGIAAQGQTLSASHTLADADGLGVISYQWLANGSAITGATGSSYVLTEAEVGQPLTVTASYSDGRGTNESVSSTATAAVANVNDAPTGSVTIAGIAAQGQTLSASHTLADADGLGVISYQWLANGSAISGATGSSYVLTEAEVGQPLTVTASYSDGHGTNESVSSAATAAVANVNDAPTGSVTIAGIAAQGQTLSASHTLADADGLGVISYQWLANGSAITGATGSSYVLTEAEVGQTLTVTASYSDGHGTNESAVSAATAAVANVTSVSNITTVSNINNAPINTVTGTAAQGQTLTTTAAQDQPLTAPPPPVINANPLGMPPIFGDMNTVTSAPVDSRQSSFKNTANTDSHDAVHLGIIRPGNENNFDAEVSLSNKTILSADSIIAPQGAVTVEAEQYIVTASWASESPPSLVEQLKENRLADNFIDLLANVTADYTVDMNRSFTQSEEQALWQHLTAMKNQIDDSELRRNSWEISVAVFASVTLTAGFVRWILRSGSLLASLFSSVSLLKRFDPLPIFVASKNSASARPENQEHSSDGIAQDKVERLFSGPIGHDNG